MKSKMKHEEQAAEKRRARMPSSVKHSNDKKKKSNTSRRISIRICPACFICQSIIIIVACVRCVSVLIVYAVFTVLFCARVYGQCYISPSFLVFYFGFISSGIRARFMYYCFSSELHSRAIVDI